MASLEPQQSPSSKAQPLGLPAGRRATLPAWSLSVLLHALVVALLAAVLRQELKGMAPETVRFVDVVLKHRSDEGDYYESPEESLDESLDVPEVSQPDGQSSPTSDSEPSEEPPPLDPTDSLPPRDGPLGPAQLSPSLLSGVGRMTDGANAPRTPQKSKARTRVFGVAGEGYKFVYVFDRSGSMGGSGRSPLEAAKEELLASLDDLQETHQFQIIFYSERPIIFSLAGREGKLVFGTRQNKQAAARFVRSIFADGPTRHEEALMAAIRMRPDVIFLLTDADEPSLTSTQLRRIRQANDAVSSINAIQFGLGPPGPGPNFLMQLAQENGGQYAYIDVTRFRSEPRNGKE